MWDALDEILEREDRSLHDLCSEIDVRRHESTLTAAVRVYILGYFMAAATGPGHADAGHGRLRGGTVHPMRAGTYAGSDPPSP